MNRLSKESSPYLLQHAGNPVDWFPWGNEAFAKAAKEDKPVFLSIGYSTCHWCHVMEKESFEDEETARIMNEVFISIKVDREERPDIDGIYMQVCQMLTGSGGWPLTIIMTPDKKPFFAGTYFPKESRFGRPGMKELIPQIKEIWVTRRDEIDKSASEIVNALSTETKTKSGTPDENIIEKALAEFQNRFDTEYGGFGSAPKFPSPHNLSFLLRYYKSFRNEDSLKMVEKTVTEMRQGGIYDQIGYGFHRYSTDRQWLVPHFEKMLYDQALLTTAYTELFQATGKKNYRETAEEILGYVIRDMTSPEGGFYSAEDADSEGEEGKFYLWTKDEIDERLGKDSALLSKIYNIKREGNFSDPLNESGEPGNILHLKNTLQELSQETGLTEEALRDKINKAGKKLFEIRELRVHPYKDDKILTDWNGLMISAFAKAARAFGNSLYRDTALKALRFIMNNLRTEEGRLLHRFRNEEAGITGNLDDYAFMVSTLIDLYETTFDISLLQTAIELNEHMINHFYDNKNGGFFFTPDYGEKLITRNKEIYDGAIPSGNSAAVLNLLKLGRITGNAGMEDKADKTFRFFSEQLNRMPSAFANTLSGMIMAYRDSLEIVIAGNKGEKDTEEILEYFGRQFIPNKVILLKQPGEKSLTEIAPFTEEMVQQNGAATVYICRHYACEMPVTSVDQIIKLLG